MIRTLLALALLAGCATVPAPPMGVPPDAPLDSTSGTPNTKALYVAVDSALKIHVQPALTTLHQSPPDTIAIRLLYSISWHLRDNDPLPPHITIPTRPFEYRLVVLSDGTASIERYDGGRWTTLRMR